eukprot:scaffold1186_cov399-Prasinococcus_capsulatus_cf.AAC.2
MHCARIAPVGLRRILSSATVSTRGAHACATQLQGIPIHALWAAVQPLTPGTAHARPSRCCELPTAVAYGFNDLLHTRQHLQACQRNDGALVGAHSSGEWPADRRLDGAFVYRTGLRIVSCRHFCSSLDGRLAPDARPTLWCVPTEPHRVNLPYASRATARDAARTLARSAGRSAPFQARPLGQRKG